MNDQIIKQALQERRKLEIFSYSLIRDWGLAEDAVQEAYVVLYKKQDSLSDKDNIHGWLKKIVRDKSIDIIRKNQRNQKIDSELVNLVEQSFDRNEHIVERDRLKTLQKVLDQCMDMLNKEDLTILKRFYLKKRSCESIAERIKSSVNAVRLKLSRLRAKLRKCSENKLDELGELF